MYFTGSFESGEGKPAAANARSAAAHAKARSEEVCFVWSGMKKETKGPFAYSVGSRDKSTRRRGVFEGIARKDNGRGFRRGKADGFVRK